MCVFCDIASGKAKAFRIYEDERYMAILDVFPNIKGQTLVMPKAHVDSYAFDMNEEDFADFMKATRKVGKMLEIGLGARRVHAVLEGTAINHLHAKLYPAMGLKDKHETHIADKTIYFDRYEGYVTTLLGPKADDKDLEATMNEILENNKNER